MGFGTWLVLLAALGMAVPAPAVSDGVTPLWSAPWGLDQAPAAVRWQQDLAWDYAIAPPHCPPAAPPRLDLGTPARAFRLTAGGERPVVYTKDAMVNRLVVIGRDAQGCPFSATTGRALPFRERWVLSPLANVRLPPGAPVQQVTVVISDGKTIRPWLQTSGVDAFERTSAALWVLLGLHAGILLVLLIIGWGLRRSHPGPIANAYLIYIVTQVLYQLQALGTGPAWLPGWPQGAAFPYVQGLAAAGVVTGLGTAMVAFLRPQGLLRRIIIGGVTVSAVAFLASGLFPPVYRLGAISMLMLAPAVLVMLVISLRRSEPWIRWFAVGLGATIVGGGAQTAGVVFNGTGLSTLGSFAFPLGNLVEAVCWLGSMLVRLRAERLEASARLHHEATHDVLTGLPNRLYLATHYARGAAPGRCAGVVMLNLDRFTHINESLGYAVGDEVLVAVARLLRALAPPSATVAHLGADQFAILSCGGSEGNAQAVADDIMAALRNPLPLTNGALHVRASLGVVCAPGADTPLIDILRDADSALHLAKVGGGNRSVRFQPVMRVPAHQRFRLEQDMMAALCGDEFQLHFQPIVALDGGRAVGMEALVRWNQPLHGWQSPGDFIPMAEETGLIVPLGNWVLLETVRQIRRWKSAGRWREGFYVSVNLSGNQLLDDSLLQRLDALLAEGDIHPGELRLELTETAVIGNIDAASSVLPALRERHIPLYMDDFGTGYSSLSYLHELPFDVLKIDRAFVMCIESRNESEVLVRTVLAMARAMGLAVVAEGIETRGQATLLAAMGCPYGQGFLFCRPLPALQLEGWLA